jgi:hypothetical protein
MHWQLMERVEALEAEVARKKGQGMSGIGGGGSQMKNNTPQVGGKVTHGGQMGGGALGGGAGGRGGIVEDKTVKVPMGPFPQSLGGQQVYQGACALHRKRWGSRGITAETHHPLSPGTLLLNAGKCWRCSGMGHGRRPGGGSNPCSGKQIPEREMEYRRAITGWAKVQGKLGTGEVPDGALKIPIPPGLRLRSAMVQNVAWVGVQDGKIEEVEPQATADLIDFDEEGKGQEGN